MRIASALAAAVVIWGISALAVLMPAAASEEDYLHLSGYIRDESTKRGVGGAIIEAGVPGEAGYKQTVSFDDGYYNMTLPAGSMPVKVSAPGYRTYTGTVNLSSNMTLDFDLEKGSASSGCAVAGAVMAVPPGTCCTVALLRRRGPA